VTSPEEFAQAQIRTALESELHEDARSRKERAEMLHAIARESDVPIERLLWWIHFRHAGKQWSGVEWRAWCAKWRELNRLLEELQSPEIFMCPHCWSHAARKLGEGRAWCDGCGEVQL
jgi:hypothetical protein